MSTCHSRRVDGSPCRANAQRGKQFCFFHDPARKAQLRRARKAGGKSRARKTANLAPNTPDYPLRNPTDAATLLGNVANRLLRDEMDARTANAIANVVNIALHAFEQGPTEERFANLEAQLDAMKKKAQ